MADLRPDLLEAQASVDWVESHFPDLFTRLHAWQHDKVSIEFEKMAPPSLEDGIMMVLREPFPLSLSVEVGAYINALRSSLDILAMALVRRHGLQLPVECVQFPIAKDESKFAKGKYRGIEFVKALPVADQKIIEDLKPYDGANDILATLHNLDITRKHHQLLNVGIRPAQLRLKNADLSNFTPINSASGFLVVGDRTLLGFYKSGMARPSVMISPYVGFDETGPVHGAPVLSALRQFVELTTTIIKSFDR
ncbi:hypothetical protein [Acidisoma sp. L85]|uniref:hypothetical protein n=1 Tax=Acidisoma sp. L85 TaxID=1641850 RepID=UPI00131D789F|nr:hypothetical protein [Acidisoma sp. L85]